jgi:hypothetical protein
MKFCTQVIRFASPFIPSFVPGKEDLNLDMKICALVEIFEPGLEDLNLG